MTSKLTTLLILFFVLTMYVSCKNSNQTKNTDTIKSSNEAFFKQVTQLDEFKQEQKRVDSIMKTSGFPAKFHVEIFDSSFLNGYKGKNISLALIIEDYPYNHSQTMYTIKFDKGKQKIISIDKGKKAI